MPVIGIAEVLVKPSFNGVQKAVASELSGLDAHGVKAGRDIGGGVASGIKSMAGVIAGTVAAIGIGSFVAEAARASDATDKFKATMNFAGLDTSAIDKATKAAKEYADQTVYDLPTIQNMIAQLASNGVKDYTGLTKAAGNLNAVAGGNAETFKSVAMVMTQTAGAGKLTTENWNQLSGAIPGAAGPLMKAMKDAGAYTGNFRDAMEKSQITADEFNDALMKLGMNDVAVQAAKSTATYEGALGNLQATINSGLMAALGAIKPAATGAITALSNGLAKAFDATGAAAQGLYDLIVKGDFTGALGRAFHVEEDNKLVSFLLTARTAVLDFWAGVTLPPNEWVGPLEGALAVGAKVRDAFTTLGSAFAPIVPGLLALWYALSPIHLAFQALAPVLPVIIGAFASLAATVGGALSSSLPPVAFAMNSLVAAVSGVLIAVLPSVVGLLGSLASTFAIAAPLAANLVAALAPLVADVLDKMGPVLADLTSTLLPAAVGLLDTLLKAVGPLIQNVTDAIKNIPGGAETVATALVMIAGAYGTYQAAAALAAAKTAVFAAAQAFITGSGFLSTLAQGTLWFIGLARSQGIAAAAQWALNMAMSANPIGLIVAAIAALVAGLVWFFTQTELGKQIVANVWQFIQDSIRVVGDWFSGTLVPAFQTAIQLVGNAFTWLNDNIIQPVFSAVGIAIKSVGDLFAWLNSSIVQPVFAAIGAAMGWWWTNIFMPTFQAVQNTINAVGAAFNWLYANAIKPAFDGIGSAISWVWDNIIKPVIDFISDAVQNKVPAAFEQGKKFIDDIWKGIQDVVKAPVKFVVQTVLNDGLIGAFNSVAGFLGSQKLGLIQLPSGFADGGYTGDGDKYQPAGIVHAGEFVFTKAQTARAGVRNLYALASMLNGFAEGGLVSPLDRWVLSQGYKGGAHNGIDMAAPVGTPIHAPGPGRVSFAGWGLGGLGGNEMHIDLVNGLQVWLAHQSRFAASVGDVVKQGQTVGYVGQTGAASGPHLHYMVLHGGWPNYTDPTPYLMGGGEARGGAGFNPVAAIIDGLMGQFKAAFPQGGFVIDLMGGVAKNAVQGVSDFIDGIFGGKKPDNSRGEAESSIPHLFRDQGGVLPEGLSMVLNRTGSPEWVFNRQQLAALDGAVSGGAQVHNHFDGLFGFDPDELLDRQETRRRDALAMEGILE